MAAFTNLRLGRRPVHSRVIAFHRASPDAARRVLPAGLEPCVASGTALLVLCYTRLGGIENRFLPSRNISTHHLSYRVCAQTDEGERVTWIARRETSSRLDARWNETVLRREHGRSRFEIQKDAFQMVLSVVSAQREELYLKVELADAGSGLFHSPRAVQEFLDECGLVKPHDALAPEADVIDASYAFAPEPLAVHELRSTFLDEHFGTKVKLDGAWQLTSRRSQPARVRTAHKLRARPNVNELPAV